MTPIQSIQIAAILSFGAAIQGAAGLGMALVAVPLMLRVIPQTMVPPMSVTMCIVVNSLVLWKLRKSVSRALIVPLVLSAAVGIMPGVLLLKYVPAPIFKKCAGAFIAAAGVLLLTGLRCPVSSRPLQLIVGFAAGVINGALSTAGPVIATFLTAGSVDKDTFRASIAAFFLAANLLTIAAMASQGLLNAGLLRAAAVAAPAVLIASHLGLRLAGTFSENTFRRIIILIIIASGASLIV